MRRLRLTRARSERGATAVFVAVMLVTLLAFSSIAIDLGAVWWDRKQAQNGADAAALAIAQACAEGGCPGNPDDTADEYADMNTLATQDYVGTALVDPDAGEVTAFVTTTRQHWLGPLLEPLLGIRNSTDVSTQATAAWGSPGGLQGLPLAFNKCVLDALIGSGTVPEEGTGFILLGLQDPGNAGGNGKGNAPPDPGIGDCAETTTPSGFYLAGGFGWLTTEKGECVADYEYTVGDDLLIGDSSPGRAAPSGCDQALLDALLDTTMLVPVYTGTNAQGGSGGDYHIEAFAAFKLTAFDLSPGNNLESKRPGLSPSCGNNDKDCPKQWIYGQFVRYVSLDSASLDDSIIPGDYGVSVVLLVD